MQFLYLLIVGLGLGFTPGDRAVRETKPEVRAAASERCGPLNALRRSRQGVVALEFAMVAPVFLLFLFAVLGAGLDGFYQLTLDDAVRDAARQLQIGSPANASGPGFVTAVCNEFAILAPNCSSVLTYNVQANAPPALFASLTPLSMPASGRFSNAFPALSSSNNVLVQVSYPLPFAMPLIGSLITFTGTNSILSTATVRIEPYG